jgi:hypothetical protein
MSSTASQILRLELIGTGDQVGTWGNTTNTNLGTLLEGAIAGLASVSVTSANQALTATDYAADQARMAILTLTTTTSANFSIYAPPVSKTYVVYNNSAYPITLRCWAIRQLRVRASRSLPVRSSPSGQTVLTSTSSPTCLLA